MKGKKKGDANKIAAPGGRAQENLGDRRLLD